MQAVINMRDRRNTNISVSSTSSTHSSTLSASSRTSLSEKRHFSPPPPTPTEGCLPSPVTKENHSRPNSRSRWRMVGRVLGVVLAVVVMWRVVFRPTMPYMGLLSDGQLQQTGGNVTAFQEDAPDEPMAVRVVDGRGYARWTVAIPHDSMFPLRSQQYRDICKQGDELRENITSESRLVQANEWRRKHPIDHTYLDVDHAEQTGLLPSYDPTTPDNICSTSLTFVLGPDDASFGTSLLHLWLSYGLAQREGRAFFIDDSRWAYGSYTSFFAPPPLPSCLPPPRHHIVPCPSTASHLLISSATIPWTFGPAFTSTLSQPRKPSPDRHRRIYDLLRTGYTTLFHLAGDPALYASSRLARFREESRVHGDSSILALHIRRGDRRPLEYQYSQDYLPLTRYAASAHAHAPSAETTLLLASDDPEIFDAPELRDALAPLRVQPAQDRIQLATKKKLDAIAPATASREPGSAYVKHVEENSGWEGGFYSSLFFALGKDSRTPEADDADVLPGAGLAMRELVGKAYLLDLAVLGASDAVVCAVSSATCRVLGVMMGWEAVKEGRWVNVDDGRGWSWDGKG